MEEEKHEIVIVGAGLAGSLLALMLAQRGKHVRVFEYRDDPRRAAGGKERARSINLALSTRGLTALNKAGLEERLREIGVPMHGRCLHSVAGTTELQRYGQQGQYLLSVSRSRLNEVLIDAAAQYGDHVSISFGQKCETADLDTGTLEFGARSGTKAARTRVQAKHIIGADGSFSRVRGAMQKKDRFNFQQSYLPAGYKELSIPPGPQGEYQMEPHALHIWPRHKFMLIALPNLDGSFTCTLFMDFEGPQSFAALKTEQDVEAFFRAHFKDALPLMPTLVEDFFANPTPSLVTIRCDPFHHMDRALLIGDAAHAIVPFFGQGINAGFEDVRILTELMDSHEANAGFDEALFRSYTAARKENADAIADLALSNYDEMASKTASAWFRVRRRMGLLLNKVAPGAFMPLYSMISFSNIPYAESVRRSKMQEERIKSILFASGALVLGATACLAGARHLVTSRR
ncbi:Kynurenine 3-monooxygenase [Porphyridium purpureum]|uniref:Kynurenine 3-monooxygenase n=1 Tax=Porphyridium purpureum TaxID=35688 RepID=A0A5J4Z4J9_PORPP|nr:Kynurenine 3-monooxygenase [Porphyridium purpureum]|eukprot:POR7928..scf295_1